MPSEGGKRCRVLPTYTWAQCCPFLNAANDPDLTGRCDRPFPPTSSDLTFMNYPVSALDPSTQAPSPYKPQQSHREPWSLWGW